MKIWILLGKKLLLFRLSLLVLSAAVFFAARLAPGDPLTAYYGQRAERLSPQERARTLERLGLDGPVWRQYLRWLSGAVRGDFGVSLQYRTGVAEVISGRVGNTLLLGGGGFLLIFLLAPLLGLLCVWQEGRPLDRLLCRAGTLSSCIPEFWLSLVLILVFSAALDLLPSGGAYSMGGGGGPADRAAHLVLPLTAVVLSHLWYYACLMRSLLAQEVRRDCALLARAAGLSRGQVLLRRCLRSALPPYLSTMAAALPHILGGTYLVETLFSYPGLGSLSYESARYHDYNLLTALCLLSGGAVMLCGMLAQAAGARLDPRLDGGEREEAAPYGP